MSAPALPSSRMDVEGRQGIPPADADNGNENAFESASSKVWKLYEVETDKYDTELAGTWKGVTDAMLIFTGLFSAVVSAFIIETYKMLLPDNGGATVALLTQLVTQSQPNGGASATSSAIPSTVTSAFTPSGIAIRINILMFLSLFLSLTCALMSTLIQQWAREYLQYSQLSAPPQKRGRVRAYLFEGLTKFQMRRMVESIPVLLHISVFLFFFAFSEFLRTINHTVGVVARCCVTILLSAYLVLSALPLVVSSSPYQTALTTPLRPCFIFLRFIVRFPLQAMKGLPPISLRSFLAAAVQHNRSRDLLADTERRATRLDHLALEWLLENVDEDSMDKFVSGLPALIHSPLITDATITVGALVTDGMLERVEEHLKSSMASRELSQSASIARAFACLESLDAIFSVLEWTDHPRCTRTISALVKSSDVFRTRQDSALALRAACIRALTFRKLIGPLSARATTHPLRMPPHLLPLALRLQTWTRINSRLWRNQSYLDEAEMRLAPDGYDAPATVIYDGHLISFLVLIRDVLSYAERPTLELTSVWETLETMVGDFTINQPAASAAARSRLEEIRTEIREYLFVPQKGGSREGPNKVSLMHVSFNMDNLNMATVGGLTTSGDGTALRVPNRSPTSKVDAMVQKSLPVHIAERYSQLLEFTDKVAKGLRLVTVLSAKLPQSSATEPFTHTSELRLRHQIYAQDPFSSIDVLDVFLTNLPLFVQATSEANARYTVEDIITSDGLFRSISGHLETSINSEVPETTRERTSMTCLQVLEQVFTLLKGSPTVRWYEVGVDALLSSANNVAFSSGMVGEASAIHAYCTLGIIIHVVIGQLRSRTAQNLDEQLFVLKIYDWLCLGDEQERARREDRAQGDANTNREASSPQYLSELLTNGPFQNFSIMAFHMVPHLEDKEAIPDVAWTTLRELRDALNLADVDDPVALHYFGVVRKSAHQAVVDAEGSPSKEQLDVLELLNNVAEELGLPNLPMPNPVTPPQTPPGVFVPPNRSEYAPIYI